MIGWLIALGAFGAWFASSRLLFRRWVRNDTFTVRDYTCSHGHMQLHRDEQCRNPRPMAKGQVAMMAMLASLAWPVALLVASIMHNAPQGRTEMAKRTADLERENDELRLKLDGGSRRSGYYRSRRYDPRDF